MSSLFRKKGADVRRPAAPAPATGRRLPPASKAAPKAKSSSVEVEEEHAARAVEPVAEPAPMPAASGDSAEDDLFEGMEVKEVAVTASPVTSAMSDLSSLEQLIDSAPVALPNDSGHDDGPATSAFSFLSAAASTVPADDDALDLLQDASTGSATATASAFNGVSSPSHAGGPTDDDATLLEEPAVPAFSFIATPPLSSQTSTVASSSVLEQPEPSAADETSVDEDEVSTMPAAAELEEAEPADGSHEDLFAGTHSPTMPSDDATALRDLLVDATARPSPLLPASLPAVEDTEPPEVAEAGSPDSSAKPAFSFISSTSEPAKSARSIVADSDGSDAPARAAPSFSFIASADKRAMPSALPAASVASKSSEDAVPAFSFIATAPAVSLLPQSPAVPSPTSPAVAAAPAPKPSPATSPSASASASAPRKKKSGLFSFGRSKQDAKPAQSPAERAVAPAAAADEFASTRDYTEPPVAAVLTTPSRVRWQPPSASQSASPAPAAAAPATPVQTVAQPSATTTPAAATPSASVKSTPTASQARAETLEDAVLYAETRVATLRDRFARLETEQQSLVSMMLEVSKELLSTQVQLNATEQEQIAAGDREDYNAAEELNDVIDGLKRQMEQLNKRLRSINESLKQHHDRKVHMVEAEVSVRSELFSRLGSLQAKEEDAVREQTKATAAAITAKRNQIEIDRDRIQRRRLEVQHAMDVVEADERELQARIHADGRDVHQQRDLLVKERTAVQSEIEELEARLAILRGTESSLSERIGALEDTIADISSRYASKTAVLQQERADWQARSKELDRAELSAQEGERLLEKERVDSARLAELRKDRLAQMRARSLTVVETTARLGKSAQITKEYLLSRQKAQDLQTEREAELHRLRRHRDEVDDQLRQAHASLSAAEDALSRLTFETAALTQRSLQLEHLKRQAVAERNFKEAGRVTAEIKAAAARVEAAGDEQRHLRADIERHTERLDEAKRRYGEAMQALELAEKTQAMDTIESMEPQLEHLRQLRHQALRQGVSDLAVYLRFEQVRVFAEMLLKRLQLGLDVAAHPTVDEFLAAEERGDADFEEALRSAPPAPSDGGDAGSAASSPAKQPSQATIARILGASSPRAHAAPAPTTPTASPAAPPAAAKEEGPKRGLSAAAVFAAAGAAAARAEVTVDEQQHDLPDEAQARSMLRQMDRWIDVLKQRLEEAVEKEDFEVADTLNNELNAQQEHRDRLQMQLTQLRAFSDAPAPSEAELGSPDAVAGPAAVAPESSGPEAQVDERRKSDDRDALAGADASNGAAATDEAIEADDVNATTESP